MATENAVVELRHSHDHGPIADNERHDHNVAVGIITEGFVQAVRYVVEDQG